jgi:tRNA(Ile)-lysidine synthase TilS/MesJ
MIHLTHPLPDNNKFFVACSGGVDSMSALHWLARGNRMPYAIIHVHHNTGAYADRALQFVAKHYQDYCFDLIVKHVKGVPPQGASKELP